MNNNPDKNLLFYIENLYTYIKNDIFSEGKLSTGNIMDLLTKLILVIEKYKELTGKDKKEIVISVIVKMIENNDFIQEEKDALVLFIHLTMPYIIDTMISAINGNIHFDNTTNTQSIFNNFLKLFSCLCKCYSKRQNNVINDTKKCEYWV